MRTLTMGNIRRTTRNLEKLILKIKKLAESNVESGYFIEQGDHPEAGIPFVSLMYKHAMGAGELHARDPLPVTSNIMKIGSFQKNAHNNLSKYLYTSSRLSTLLDKTGKEITLIATSTFGSTSYYQPNSPQWAEIKGDNTPLVYEGHLRDAWSYRTSDNQFIRK